MSVRDVTVTTSIVDPLTGGRVFVSVIGDNWMAGPLTLCCDASVTGSDGGIVCRSCYGEVDWSFGRCWSEAGQVPSEIRSAVLAAVDSVGGDCV